MGALKKMLVISHRRFLPPLERKIFCLPAFSYLIIKAFWVMDFPLFSVFHRLFGNMTWRCLAQMSGPPTTTISPTSLLPAITPSPTSPVTCTKFPLKILVICYNIFSACGKGIFSHLFYCSLPHNFLGITCIAEGRVTYFVKSTNPGKNFYGLYYQ